ncbi:MAG: cytochrome c maturation protein CcmE [Chloroflexi bacterium]|nr:cytochrome c maturation protein CcmE [Chloroflexota bacterium]
MPRLLIGGLVIALAALYLLYSTAQGATTYYLTVEEVKAQGPSGRNVRVAGDVLGESIVWDARALVLQFEITDASGVLPVSYHGPRPDMFQDGATAVLEGRYTAEGIFEAQTLLLKCPSKYEGAE